MTQDTTTESEPTPGPWILTAVKGGEFNNNPRGRIAILEQPPKEGGVNTLALTYDDSPKSVANARLIAAAPDLRNALRKNLEHAQGASADLDTGDNPEAALHAIQSIIEDATEALEAAEGEA